MSHRSTAWLGLLLLTAAAQADLRLFVFDCGVIELDTVEAFGLGNDETPVRELFVPCYLIEHGVGDAAQRLLFDAGLPMALAGRGTRELEPDMRVRYGRALEEQLDDLGLSPRQIDFVAFSHLHFDHVGSANLFTESTLLIQRAEYEAGFGAADPRLFDVSLYGALRDVPRVLLDGDHDVFGDGRVQLISAPGHTPGHQALLVRLEETGPVLLSGDLYHFRESRALRRVPVFNTDSQQTLAAMERIEALLEHEGAILWIEHDKALGDSQRKAPAFYR